MKFKEIFAEIAGNDQCICWHAGLTRPLVEGVTVAWI